MDPGIFESGKERENQGWVEEAEDVGLYLSYLTGLRLDGFGSYRGSKKICTAYKLDSDRIILDQNLHNLNLA